MPRHHPPLLYKYFPPERVDILERLLIRYSPLTAFNDPFEGRPVVTQLKPEPELTETIRQILDEEAERSYESLGDALKEAVSLDKYKQWVRERGEAEAPRLREQFQHLLPQIASGLSRPFENRIGTLSLAEERDSLLMWAHYAASHSGFAIEFDANHSYFHEQRTPNDELRHIRRVLYRDTRPSFALTSLEPADIFLVKSTHWSHEKEWRILRAFDEATEVREHFGSSVHLFAIPSQAISAVITGARCDVGTVERIKSALRANPQLRHVTLFRAEPDESNFMLRFTDAKF